MAPDIPEPAIIAQEQQHTCLTTAATSSTINKIHHRHNNNNNNNSYSESKSVSDQSDILTNKSTDTSNTIDNNTNPFVASIRWPDLIVQTFLHVGAVYGLYLMFYANFFSYIWSKYYSNYIAILIFRK